MLIASCGYVSPRHQYEQFKQAHMLEEWDLSGTTHCDLLLWYSINGAPEFIYGTRIDDEDNGRLSMRWDKTTDVLELLHLSGKRYVSITAPYRLAGRIRKHSPIRASSEPYVIATGAANDKVVIYCRVTPTTGNSR